MAAVEPHPLVDSAAIARLFDLHYGRVLSYCQWRLGRREDAEDAAQTTFLNAHRALGRGTTPRSEGSWLLAIAHNVCLARWRAERSRPAEVAQEPETMAAFAAPESDPELLGRIRDALARLPEQQRRAYVLREWQGLGYEEIAEQLSISEGAVASLVFRARQSLATTLRDERGSRRNVGLNVGSLLGWAKSLLGGTVAKIAIAGAVVGAAGVAALPLAVRHDGPRPHAPSVAGASAVPARGVHGRPVARETVTGRATRPKAAHATEARSVGRLKSPTAPIGSSGESAPAPVPAPPASASSVGPASPPAPVSAPSVTTPVTVSPPAVPNPTDVVGQVTDVAQQTLSQVSAPPLPPAPKLGP